MAVVQLTDVIVPSEFTDYVVQNTFEKTALVMSNVAARNAAIENQLRAGAEAFNIPFWNDLGNDEADLVSDDPDSHSTPKKIDSGKQMVRKSYLHQSWSAMNLASELAGSDALNRIQNRVSAYWERQLQRRLIASLKGILADNEANDSGDMLNDISGETGAAALFSPEAVIDTTASFGDNLDSVSAIAMHSAVYRKALKDDLIATVQDSQGRSFKTYRGLAVIVDDGLAPATDVYLSVMFGPGAVGYGMADPVVSAGTEIENIPSAGDGGGQQVLHSRTNIAVHPAGFKWTEGTVTADSPSLAELEIAGNWDRVVDRKAIPLAFLRHKI